MNFNNPAIYTNEESIYASIKNLPIDINMESLRHENLHSSNSMTFSEHAVGKDTGSLPTQEDHNSTNDTPYCLSPENSGLFSQHNEGPTVTMVTSSNDESTQCNSPILFIDICSGFGSPELPLINENSQLNEMAKNFSQEVLRKPLKRNAKKNAFQKIKIESDSEDEFKPESPRKVSKKVTAPKKAKKQNKMKNFSGLIAQRVKTMLTTGIGFGVAFMQRVEERQQNEFKKFLAKYEKQWKTWSSIRKYVKSDHEMGELFLKAIFEFLREENSDDYNYWVSDGKMKNENKYLAKSCKEFFVKGFSDIQNDIPSDVSEMIFEDEAEEFEDNVAKKVKVDSFKSIRV